MNAVIHMLEQIKVHICFVVTRSYCDMYFTNDFILNINNQIVVDWKYILEDIRKNKLSGYSHTGCIVTMYLGSAGLQAKSQHSKHQSINEGSVPLRV